MNKEFEAKQEAFYQSLKSVIEIIEKEDYVITDEIKPSIIIKRENKLEGHSEAIMAMFRRYFPETYI